MTPRLSGKMMVWLLATVWFQMSFVPFLTFRDTAPDTTFLLLAFFSFFIDFHGVFIYAFLVGILRDLLSNSFFGLETTSLVIGSFVLSQIAMRFDRLNERVQWAGTFAFSFVTLLVSIVLFSVTSRERLFDGAMVFQSAFIALYTTFAGLILFPFFRFVFRLKPHTKQYDLF